MLSRILRIAQPPGGDPASAQRDVQAGSQDALARVISDHHVAVRGYLLHLLRDASVADDLAQEVFISYCRQWGAFRGDGSLRAWLLGIARNLAVQHIRNETRRRSREHALLQMQLAQWRVDRSGDAPCQEDHDRALAALGECLQRLAPEARRTVEAHYFKGQTIEAIAQNMGRAAGGVRMMLLRIRGALGQCIRRQLQQEQ